jgi:hypothetical protein
MLSAFNRNQGGIKTAVQGKAADNFQERIDSVAKKVGAVCGWTSARKAQPTARTASVRPSGVRMAVEGLQQWVAEGGVGSRPQAQ